MFTHTHTCIYCNLMFLTECDTLRDLYLKPIYCEKIIYSKRKFESYSTLVQIDLDHVIQVM